MSDPVVIADAVRFADGSILDFSEMEPPEAGSVLAIGNNSDDSGFVIPETVIDIPTQATTTPSVPPSLVLGTAVDTEREGEVATATVTATWTAPTTNDDDSELLDLAGFNLEYSVDGGSNFFMLGGSPTFNYDELTTVLRGILCGASVVVRVYAVNYAGTQSVASEQSITAAGSSTPEQVTGLVLTGVSAAGTLQAAWTALSRTSLYGYELQFQASTNNYPNAATFVAWATPSAANTIIIPLRPGANPTCQFVPADYAKWYKVRVRSVLFGGATGAWSDDSGAIHVDISITPDKILDGIIDPTKAIVLGQVDATHKVVINAGAISGFAGLVGGVESFKLDSTGLTVRSASIYVIDGVIRIQGTADTTGMFINSAGLKCTASGVTKLALDQYGVVVTGAGSDRVYLGRQSDGSTYGLEVTGASNKIVGAVIRYGKTSGSDTTNAGYFLGNDGGTQKFFIGNAGNTASMQWDGASLTLIGGSITGGTIQTDVVGNQRVVLTGSKMYLVSSTLSAAYAASIESSSGNSIEMRAGWTGLTSGTVAQMKVTNYEDTDGATYTYGKGLIFMPSHAVGASFPVMTVHNGFTDYAGTVHLPGLEMLSGNFTLREHAYEGIYLTTAQTNAQASGINPVKFNTNTYAFVRSGNTTCHTDFAWSTGDTGNVLRVTKAGWYMCFGRIGFTNSANGVFRRIELLRVSTVGAGSVRTPIAISHITTDGTENMYLNASGMVYLEVGEGISINAGSSTTPNLRGAALPSTYATGMELHRVF